ncbi:MAG: TetR/AcrR family transcriptional regulator [Lachnospiraceae bacterium]|nr:TetR/AcrR family transcriptional regulator [Lachnospiraceae bacterium]
MNPKFFDVKKEKQDAIINAALMVFAENGYRKASTDVIVKEAGISKGLLFHYFISKQGLYEFVYDYSVKYMMLELMQNVRKEEKDFFVIQRMIELAKIRVMKNYPYMQQFLSGVKYENHPDALKVIGENDKAIDDTYNNIYKKADMSMFHGQIDQKKMIRMIGWMSDGYIKDKFREGMPDPDEMNEEFTQYLSMLREHFYDNSGNKVKPMPAAEDAAKKRATRDEAERDDSVMDSIREEILYKTAQEPQKDIDVKQADKAVKQPEEEPVAEPVAVPEPAPAEPAEEVPEEKLKEQPEEQPEEKTEEKHAEDTNQPEAKPRTKGFDLELSFEERLALGKRPAYAINAEEPGSNEVEDENNEKAEKVKSLKKTLNEKAVTDAKDKESGIVGRSAVIKSKPEEVTISIDSFDSGYKGYGNFGAQEPDATYAASSTVASYVPSTDLSFYEESRLGDFTYGSDARGGRGIPYDSSDNIQIFVAEEDDDKETVSEEPVIKTGKDKGHTETPYSDDPFDISDLSEKIMSNTDRETAEADRNREIESMGPAPILPDFSPENIRNKKSSVDEENDDVHIYRPLKF